MDASASFGSTAALVTIPYFQILKYKFCKFVIEEFKEKSNDNLQYSQSVTEAFFYLFCSKVLPAKHDHVNLA